MGNGLNYGTDSAMRGFLLKTDFNLNAVDMCYQLGEPPNTFTITANTISIWKDMSVFEPMVEFDLTNEPFLATISLSLED